MWNHVLIDLVKRDRDRGRNGKAKQDDNKQKEIKEMSTYISSLYIPDLPEYLSRPKLSGS